MDPIWTAIRVSGGWCAGLGEENTLLPRRHTEALPVAAPAVGGLAGVCASRVAGATRGDPADVFGLSWSII